MNINEKDGKIIKVSIVIFLAVVYFNIFLRSYLGDIFSNIESVTSLSESLSKNPSAQKAYEELDVSLNKIIDTQNQIKTKFPSFFNHADLILQIKQFEKTSDIEIISLDTSEATAFLPSNELKQVKIDPSVIQITDPRILKTMNDSKIQYPPISAETGKGFAFTVKISTKGSYESVMTFLKNFMELKNKVSIKKLDISKNPDNTFNGNFSIIFYGIKDRK